MKGIFTSICIGSLIAILAGEAALRVLANFLPDVAYLSHAGAHFQNPAASTLSEFVSAPEYQLHPHTDWYGSAKNQFGLLGRDFEIPKPAGKRRIIAIGDSFVHGAVPYRTNVITLVEEHLHAQCVQKNFEILNLGFPGAGVWEYSQLVDVALHELQPDAIFVNLYLGNDGPDVFHGTVNFPRVELFAMHSYVYQFVRNSFLLLRGTSSRGILGAARSGPGILPASMRTSRLHVSGGQPTGAKSDYSDDQPPLNTPTILGDEWQRILKQELYRFYAPREESAVEKSWAPIFEKLRSMRERLAAAKIPLIIFLYPSELQVDANKKREAIAQLNSRDGKQAFPESAFDFSLPAATVLKFCSAENIPCFDLSRKVADAAKTAGKSVYIPQNTHWNIVGNQIAAEAQFPPLVPYACGDACEISDSASACSL